MKVIPTSKLNLLTGVFAVFFLLSCGAKPEDVKEIQKEGSIEMALSTDTLPNNSGVVMRIEYKVWKDNKQVCIRTITDTIPSLNYKLTEMEDNDGNSIQKYVPGKYDFFVTVK